MLEYLDPDASLYEGSPRTLRTTLAFISPEGKENFYLQRCNELYC